MSLLIADVSEFQSVDWAGYGAANPAVIVRAHNGWRADYKWDQNRDGARAHCQVRGFYQYLPASVDPVAAARAFMATVGPLQPGEFVILDIEEGAGDQRARRAAWMATVHGVNSKAVEWTYSGLWFARAHLPGVSLNWVAAYQGNEPTDAHNLWQFADNHSFSGIGACDGSQFDGSLDQLKALIGDVAPAPAPTHPTSQPAVNHNTGQATEKPWGSFPLPSNEWYGVASPNPKNHSGFWTKDQRAVKQIQREVGAPATGHFDANTGAAVGRYQTAHGLVSDKSVGPQTWAKMTQTN